MTDLQRVPAHGDGTMIAQSSLGSPGSDMAGHMPEEPNREIFYGSDQQMAEVATLWKSNRLLVLHGGAGVGKTSMLRTGVIPSLDAEGRTSCPWRIWHIGRPSPWPRWPSTTSSGSPCWPPGTRASPRSTSPK